jgi:pseudouridine synthase
VLCAFTDREGRETLADHIDVPDVYAAGRLDRDSEGLVLLTRGKRLRTDLMRPDLGHPRTYLVQVEGIPDSESLTRLAGGVELKDGRTRPADAELLDDPPELPERRVPIRVRASIPDCWLRLTLTEGRNRQVRRMTAAVGHPTLRLVRERIGPIGIDGLSPGRWEVVAGDDHDALVAGLRSLVADADGRTSRVRGEGTSRRARGRPRRGRRSPD